ncbi:Txe/YoeB family addiction module toxin [Mucilaginibacter sp.]
MEVIFLPEAIDDLHYWQQIGNKQIQNKIEQLLIAIQANPFQGIGKPEALKYKLAGKWSRRINGEHRIVYDVKDDQINVYSLKGHY